jgi:putative lipoprotein
VRLAVASVLLAVAAGIATGCGSDDGGGSLEGLPWVLSSGIEVEGWESKPPTATFAEGRVSGSTGCNRYTSSYTLDGSSLELGPVAATLMACPPPAGDVEREFVAALERVAAWRVEEGELVLLDAGDEEVLRFETGS